MRYDCLYIPTIREFPGQDKLGKSSVHLGEIDILILQWPFSCCIWYCYLPPSSALEDIGCKQDGFGMRKNMTRASLNIRWKINKFFSFQTIEFSSFWICEFPQQCLLQWSTLIVYSLQIFPALREKNDLMEVQVIILIHKYVYVWVIVNIVWLFPLA